MAREKYRGAGVKSVLHVNGTELDYKDDLMKSAFMFNNPNVKGTCGCGTSFST
jgi:iron-sulfur cluster assembly accessory protein